MKRRRVAGPLGVVPCAAEGWRAHADAATAAVVVASADEADSVDVLRYIAAGATQRLDTEVLRRNVRADPYGELDATLARKIAARLAVGDADREEPASEDQAQRRQRRERPQPGAQRGVVRYVHDRPAVVARGAHVHSCGHCNCLRDEGGAPGGARRAGGCAAAAPRRRLFLLWRPRFVPCRAAHRKRHPDGAPRRAAPRIGKRRAQARRRRPPRPPGARKSAGHAAARAPYRLLPPFLRQPLRQRVRRRVGRHRGPLPGQARRRGRRRGALTAARHKVIRLKKWLEVRRVDAARGDHVVAVDDGEVLPDLGRALDV